MSYQLHVWYKQYGTTESFKQASVKLSDLGSFYS